MWSRKERPRGHRVRAGRYFCWTVKTKKNVTSEARAGQLRWGEASSLTPATPTSDLGLISQDQSQSSKHFSPPCIEPHVPVKCPPPVLPLRPHSGGASDKEGEGGGRRQESTCVHSTHRCLCHTPGLLLPVLSSVIWPLPVCNFTKYKLCILKLFRRWTLHTNKISQSLPYLQVMQHNWSLDFFVAHFIQTILETFLLSHESFQISNLF